MCPRSPRYPSRDATRGAVTAELAIVMTVFLTLVLGTLEVARVLYLFNTVQDVTRTAARAASMTDFSNATAMAALRQRALFDGTTLPLVPNLTTAQVRIEYLAQAENGEMTAIGTLPQCPEENVRNCTLDPNGASCIRFVRASICANGTGTDACTRLPYQTMTGFAPGFGNLTVPPSATVVKAESLGYRPGNTCL